MCVCVCVCVCVLNFCCYLYVSANHMLIDKQTKKKKKNFHLVCNIILFTSFQISDCSGYSLSSSRSAYYQCFFLSFLQDLFKDNKDPGLYGFNRGLG